jgi:hypothetical protein
VYLYPPTVSHRQRLDFSASDASGPAADDELAAVPKGTL